MTKYTEHHHIEIVQNAFHSQIIKSKLQYSQTKIKTTEIHITIWILFHHVNTKFYNEKLENVLLSHLLNQWPQKVLYNKILL